MGPCTSTSNKQKKQQFEPSKTFQEPSKDLSNQKASTDTSVKHSLGTR